MALFFGEDGCKLLSVRAGGGYGWQWEEERDGKSFGRFGEKEGKWRLMTIDFFYRLLTN